jgi:hypothetical protein
MRIAEVEQGPGEPPRRVRKSTNGIVAAGTPLVIGFRSNYEIREASVRGEPQNVMVDPLAAADPLGVDYILEQEIAPTALGTYTVEAFALSGLGSPVRVTSTFLVVGEQGGNANPLQNDPPKVIGERTIPKDTSEAVEVSLYTQVVFSEPVTHVPGT